MFLKVGGIAPLGAILRMVSGRNKQRGRQGAKQHQGGQNAQPLIDHWVNFSSPILRLVSFLQILFWYDNRWRLLLQQLSVKFSLWIVYVPCYSVDYSGLRSHRKNDAAPAPELLVFVSVALASELPFFMAPAPASGRFHTLILSWLGVLQVE